MNLNIGANQVDPQRNSQLHLTGCVSFAFQLTNLFVLLSVLYVLQSNRIAKKKKLITLSMLSFLLKKKSAIFLLHFNVFLTFSHT